MPLNEQEVAMNNRLLREGLKYMFTHPRRELDLTGLKLRALYQDDEEALRGIPMPLTGDKVRHADRIADVANVYYFATLALAGIGVLLWLGRDRRALALPLLAIGVFTLGQMLFFDDPRFHYPMLPAFALLAAAGIVALADATRHAFAPHAGR
jgi:hypothetical protein